MSVAPWTSWSWDWFTAGWAFWLLFFAVWETLGLMDNPQTDPLTAHLRPVFLNSPLTWFLALGLWLWVGYHFLIEAGNPITQGLR